MYLPNRTTQALNMRHATLLRQKCEERASLGGPLVAQKPALPHEAHADADRWKLEWDRELWYGIRLHGRMFSKISEEALPFKDRQVLRKRVQALERKFKSASSKDEGWLLDSCPTIIELPHQVSARAESTSGERSGSVVAASRC